MIFFSNSYKLVNHLNFRLEITQDTEIFASGVVNYWLSSPKSLLLVIYGIGSFHAFLCKFSDLMVD